MHQYFFTTILYQYRLCFVGHSLPATALEYTFQSHNTSVIMSLSTFHILKFSWAVLFYKGPSCHNGSSSFGYYSARLSESQKCSYLKYLLFYGQNQTSVFIWTTCPSYISKEICSWIPFFFNFCWSIVAVQCWVGFYCTAKGISCTYMYTPSFFFGFPSI